MQLLLMTFAFAFSFFIIEKIGFFSNSPLSNLEILYSVPMLAASIILLIIAIISFFNNLKRSGINEWIKILSVFLIVSGFCLSYLTRFSGEVVLTEGQTFYGGHNDYIPDTLYRGRFSAIPDVGITLNKIIPSFNSDRTEVRGLKGEFTFNKKNRETPEEFVLTSGLPKLIGGSWFGMKEYGYSPRYTLKSKEGRILDSSFIFMKLFPPDSEDNFRLLSPLTYHVRYYPNGKEDIKEPLIGLRIVRNKHIVFNNPVKLSEDVAYENSRISFDEVRQWSKLAIYHDTGVFLYIPGIVLACLYMAGMVVRIIRNSNEHK